MKNIIFFILVTILFLSCNNSSIKNKNVRKIITFSPMIHQSLNSEIDGFKEGLRTNGWKDGENITIEDVNASGNWNEISRMLETIYSNSPDLVFVVSTPAAQVAAKYCKQYSVPTIYGAVTDPIVSDIVESLDKSKIPITGVTDRYPTRSQCEFFSAFFPNGRQENGLILYSPNEKNSQILSTETEKFMNEFNVKSERLVIENINDLSQKIENVINKYTFIIVNGDNAIIERISSVSNLCTKYKKPLFVGDPLSVKFGAIGSLGPDYFLMGKDAADKANRILRGEFAGNISSSNPTKFKKVVNSSIAEKIGFRIPQKVWLSNTIWESINE